MNLIVKLSNKRGALHEVGICHGFTIKVWKVFTIVSHISVLLHAEWHQDLL